MNDFLIFTLIMVISVSTLWLVNFLFKLMYYDDYILNFSLKKIKQITNDSNYKLVKKNIKHVESKIIEEAKKARKDIIISFDMQFYDQIKCYFESKGFIIEKFNDTRIKISWH